MPMPALSVAPMPEPVSRYQSPEAAVGSTPVSAQSAISFLWVPESSPREAKGASASAIFASASWASSMPAMPAGSSAGPTMTKSLYIRSVRSTPMPSATNFSSAGLAWTSSTSPSQLRGVLDRLPGADGDDVDLDAGLLLEHRQQVVVEAGIRGRGGGLDDDRSGPARRPRGGEAARGPWSRGCGVGVMVVSPLVAGGQTTMRPSR